MFLKQCVDPRVQTLSGCKGKPCVYNTSTVERLNDVGLRTSCCFANQKFRVSLNSLNRTYRKVRSDTFKEFASQLLVYTESDFSMFFRNASLKVKTCLFWPSSLKFKSYFTVWSFITWLLKHALLYSWKFLYFNGCVAVTFVKGSQELVHLPVTLTCIDAEPK